MKSRQTGQKSSTKTIILSQYPEIYARTSYRTKKKIEELKKVLLPTLHSTNLSNIQSFEYPDELEMPKIIYHVIF